MAIYPQSVKLYAYVSGAWADLTSDVVESITGYWGMRSNKELDRVADTGQMFFTLDNTAGLYAPKLGTALAGWKKGVPVKLVVRFRDRDHIRFRGVVDSMKITGGALGLRRVYVTVKDWMDYAGKYPLVSPGIQTNKRADEALTTIVNAMPIAPQGSTFSVGDETFPTVFDLTSTKTKALTEFNKLALSEMGYIYLRKDWQTGENLRFDKRTYRKGTDALTSYSVPAANDGYLLKEDGGYLLTENGDRIIIERAETFSLDVDNNMQDINVDYGNNLINRVSNIAYPRKVDTSVKVLFSLGYPQQIGAGETIELRGNYFDPTGGATVNAESSTMITPAATTDYLMNTLQDGTGTNRTSSLSVTAVYGTEGVTYTLVSSAADTCFITLLQARGYGIYTYATSESTAEDTPSINEFGYSSETLHQQYQQNTNLGKRETAKILEAERQPRTVLNKITMQANKDVDYLWGYLMHDIGDLVHVKEDETGINSYYYIQGLSFSISPAFVDGAATAIIDYGWTLKEARSTYVTGDNGYSFVTAEFTTTGGANTINFGVQDIINSLTTKSISIWFFAAPTGGGYLLSNTNGSATGVQTGWSVTIISNDIYFTELSAKFWSTPFTRSSQWINFIITKESTELNTDPVIYVNGVAGTLTPSGTQATIPSQIGNSLAIGTYYSGNDPLNGFNGKLKDIRFYDRILTASEALALYTEGASGNDNLNGLIFQAPVVNTQELTYYTDHTMLITDRVLDNIYGEVGKPEKAVGGTYPIIKLP